MKKVFSAVFSAILLVTSCQKEIGKGEIIPVTDGTITLSVSASLPDYGSETRGGLVNTVRLAWEEGDVVYVYDNEKCLGKLTAALEDDSNKYAVLSGTISNSAAEKLTLVAASEGMAPSVTTQDASIAGGITFDLATQNKPGAPYVAYSVIDKPASTDASGIKTAFQLATSVIKVNCTGVKGGTPVSQVRIKGVNTSLCLVPSASAAPAVSSSEGEGMITRTNASSFAGASGEGIMSFSVAVLEQDANADRKIYVGQEGNPGSSSFSAAALTKGLSYNTVAQICGPYKTVGGHSGVRLWEDGPYFATSNIGAQNQTEGGLFFMWGGINAYEHRSDGFHWLDGRLLESPYGFFKSNYRFTTLVLTDPWSYPINKYNDTDSRTQLEPTDDIATIFWGSGWRMPDRSEFDNLINNCNCVSFNDSEVLYGALFSGKEEYSGISVFFPTAGYGDDYGYHNGFNYWSRTLSSNNFDRAYSLCITDINETERWFGLPVRPVID